MANNRTLNRWQFHSLSSLAKCIISLALSVTGFSTHLHSRSFISNEYTMLSPQGGEIVYVGEALKVSWNIRSFTSTANLSILGWNNVHGKWNELSSRIQNTGSCVVVLSNQGETRLKIVDSKSGYEIAMNGYIVVRNRQYGFSSKSSNSDSIDTLTPMTADQVRYFYEQNACIKVKHIDVFTLDDRTVATNIEPEQFLAANKGRVLVNTSLANCSSDARTMIISLTD